VLIIDHSNISKQNGDKREIKIIGNASSLCRHGYKWTQVPAESSNESLNKKR
jgi:hypothetical protein